MMPTLAIAVPSLGFALYLAACGLVIVFYVARMIVGDVRRARWRKRQRRGFPVGPPRYD